MAASFSLELLCSRVSIGAKLFISLVLSLLCHFLTESLACCPLWSELTQWLDRINCAQSNTSSRVELARVGGESVLLI